MSYRTYYRWWWTCPVAGGRSFLVNDVHCCMCWKTGESGSRPNCSPLSTRWRIATKPCALSCQVSTFPWRRCPRGRLMIICWLCCLTSEMRCILCEPLASVASVVYCRSDARCLKVTQIILSQIIEHPVNYAVLDLRAQNLVQESQVPMLTWTVSLPS